MAGINIDIAANVRDFQKATSDAEKGLDDVSDALDALARGAQQEAEKAGRGISDGFKDGTRDAEKAVDKLGDDMGDSVKKGADEVQQETEKLERGFKDLADSAKKDIGDLGDPMAISVRKGTQEASEGVRDFKQEAKQNAEEVASSFDGSAQSIGDGFQSVAATAFAGFGPAGAIAGLAAAAGLGVIFAQLEKNDERTQKLRESVAELAEEFIDTGKLGERSVSSISDALKEMALNTEEGEDNLSDLREQAEKAGLPFDKLAQAVAGSKDEIDVMLRVTNQQIEKQKALITGSYDDESQAARNRVKSLEEVRTKLEESSATAEQATQVQKDYAAAGGDDLERRAALIEAATARQEDANKRISESNTAAAENIGSYVDAVQDAYAEAGAAVDTYVEDGVFNLQKYTEESQKQADAITSYQANMKALSETLSAEALAYIANLGPQAAPLLDAYVKAPLDQQAATAAVWTQLGKTSTDAYGNEVQYNLDQSNFTAAARLTVDDSALQAYLRKTSLSMGVTLRPADGSFGNGLGVLKRVP